MKVQLFSKSGSGREKELVGPLSSDLRSADCQDVGHLNATIKNSFFVWLTHIFSKPDSLTVVHKSLPKLKKKKICHTWFGAGAHSR